MTRPPFWVVWVVLGMAPLASAVTSNGHGDCVVQWGGSIRGFRTACEDGAACDLDGLVDGACVLDVAPCFDSETDYFSCSDVPEAFAVADSSDAPAAAVLQAALDALLAEGGSAPRCRSALVTVPVAHTLRRNRAIALHVTAESSPPFYHSEQDLELYCLPAGESPSFTSQIAPILTTRCGVAGCHVAGVWRGGLDLSERDVAYYGLLGSGKVRPDRPRRSTLRGTIRWRMPPGCHGRNRQPPPGGCLSRDERTLILEWILGGGPDN